MKWYFNELLGYLIISYTSIPVIGNDKKQNVLFLILKCFYVETATKRKQNDFIFKSYDLTNCMLVTYITDRNGRKTDRNEFKVTVSLLFNRLT